MLNPFSDQDALDDKLSVVDVKARDASGRLLHIEMQVLPERAFRSRVLYYWAELHRQQLQAGDPYLLLRPTISICLTDFVLFPEVPDYCLPFQVVNRTHGLVFAPDLLLVMLELPKFQRLAAALQDPLDVWLYFFRYAEELDSEQLPSALDMAEIHQAMEELKVLSQNDLERERYLARVKLQRDELSRLYSAREEGREEGWGKGREEGYRAGSLEEVRKTLFRLGRKRLGEPPAATVTGLEAIDDLERLEQLSERLLDVGSWEEFLPLS